jgi:hypothetical protein
MSQNVMIFVRTVGQNFGCMSVINAAGPKNKRIWESRVYPLGFTSNARDAAEAKAKAEGWRIVTPKE